MLRDDGGGFKDGHAKSLFSTVHVVAKSPVGVAGSIVRWRGGNCRRRLFSDF